jgi:hypothetical protein
MGHDGQYAGVLPSRCDDEDDSGDPRVVPLTISKIGATSTYLSALVAATDQLEARAIGLTGIERWAEQIGLDTDNPDVVSLFPKGESQGQRSNKTMPRPPRLRSARFAAELASTLQ